MTEQRFWEKVDKSGAQECWEWLASKTSGGYGQFTHGGKPGYAHRFSYELHYSPIPQGMVVRHICDNPSCVNPRHLKLGSQQQNIDDMNQKGRDHHANGEDHGLAVLTKEQVVDIYLDNRHDLDIANWYGIGRTTVRDIKSQRTWRHVTELLPPVPPLHRSFDFNADKETSETLPVFRDAEKRRLIYEEINALLDRVCHKTAELGHLAGSYKIEHTHPDTGQPVIYRVSIKGFVKKRPQPVAGKVD